MRSVPITARVHITLKPGVVDPQGTVIGQALRSLGFDAVASVRVGKIIEVDFIGQTQDEVTEDVSAMCERLLANPVVEDYRVEFLHAL